MKRNRIVPIIVAVAALSLLVVVQVQRESRQAQGTHHYRSYTEFELDFASGLITEVTLYDTNKAAGDFRPGAKGDKTGFVVPIPGEPAYHARLQGMNHAVPITYRVGTWGGMVANAAVNIIPFLLILFLYCIVPLVIILLVVPLTRRQRQHTDACAKSD